MNRELDTLATFQSNVSPRFSIQVKPDALDYSNLPQYNLLWLQIRL